MTISNPPLPGRCGLNVVIALDSSSSMGTENFDRARQAAKDFIQALSSTPSKAGLVIFNTTTALQVQLLDLASPANVSALTTALNDFRYEGGFTNWANALLTAQGLGPDLIILCTDGAPFLPGRQAEAEQAAFAAADRVRRLGTRIIAVGVGTRILPANLERVSGPSLNDDYYLTNFDSLDERLREIALRACGGSITVNKLIEQPDGSYGGGADWTFEAVVAQADADKATASLPTRSQTGNDGATTFRWQLTEPISVILKEELRPGFSPGVVTCTRNGEAIAAPASGSGVKLALRVNDVITCESRSRPLYQLLVSTSEERRDPRPLANATVSGKIYAFLDFEGLQRPGRDRPIDSVQFGLDQPRGEPGSLERFPPYDFAGGGTPIAYPFNTRTASNGLHRIYAEIRFSDGSLETLVVPFTVANQPLPYRLLVSRSADRSNPTPLEGRAVSGEVYIFLSSDPDVADGIDNVRFGLDSPFGNPGRLESVAPYDFVGGNVQRALPFDTRTVADGDHTAYVEVTLLDDSANSGDNTEEFTVPFTVTNGK